MERNIEDTIWSVYKRIQKHVETRGVTTQLKKNFPDFALEQKKKLCGVRSAWRRFAANEQNRVLFFKLSYLVEQPNEVGRI